MSNYDSSVVEKLNRDNTKRTADGITMEWKMAQDTIVELRKQVWVEGWFLCIYCWDLFGSLYQKSSQRYRKSMNTIMTL